MSTVIFSDATRIYDGSTKPAVDKLNLEIEDGEFMVFVGPSGCGKSTSLRMLAGLEEVTEGSIHIGATDVTHVQAKNRNIAMVFQNYALYPHMTVAENIGYALKIQGVPKEERATRVQEAAQLLALEDFLDRKPKNLSGGQRQRVAMGRAIVRSPEVFLMDEPLSNLDAKLRVQMRSQISALQRRLGVTTVYVTHDQVEAMTMGDRVAVLNGGLLQQVASPLELYHRPANQFVASFIGSPAMSFFDGELTETGVSFGGIEIPIPRDQIGAASSKKVRVGVRPESFEMTTSGNGIPVRIRVIEQTGADSFYYGSLANTPTENIVDDAEIVARVDGRLRPAEEQLVYLTCRADELHIFDAGNGARIND